VEEVDLDKEVTDLKEVVTTEPPEILGSPTPN
jgi:hypothetical protein